MEELPAAVLREVADAKGVTVDELELVLYNHLDPDILDRLNAHDGTSWIFSFELPEHTVTVTSDGRIHINDKQQQFWA